MNARPEPASQASSRNRSPQALASVLLLVLGLPSLPQYMGVATSMTTGLLAAALLSVLVLGCTGSLPSVGMPRGKAWLALAPAVVLGHYVLTAAMRGGDHTRFAASLVVLLVLGVAAVLMSKAIFRARPRALHRALIACFVLVSLLALIAIAGISPPSPMAYPKPVFPFTEPSHFALAFLPLMAYVALTACTLTRYLVLGLAVALGLGLQNLTLLAGSALAFMLCARPLILLAGLAFGWLGAQTMDLEYFMLRLDFSGEVQNVSNLAFVQGWQMMAEALEQSSGAGLGFQQMGLKGTEVDAARLIEGILGEQINLQDGSFTLAKLVAEFGVLGGALALLYVAYAARMALRLRAAPAHVRAESAGPTFAAVVIVFYVLELFVRGAGYFTGTGLLLVAALAAPVTVLAAPPARLAHSRTVLKAE